MITFNFTRIGYGSGPIDYREGLQLDFHLRLLGFQFHVGAYVEQEHVVVDRPAHRNALIYHKVQPAKLDNWSWMLVDYPDWCDRFSWLRKETVEDKIPF